MSCCSDCYIIMYIGCSFIIFVISSVWHQLRAMPEFIGFRRWDVKKLHADILCNLLLNLPIVSLHDRKSAFDKIMIKSRNWCVLKLFDLHSSRLHKKSAGVQRKCQSNVKQVSMPGQWGWHSPMFLWMGSWHTYFHWKSVISWQPFFRQPLIRANISFINYSAYSPGTNTSNQMI